MGEIIWLVSLIVITGIGVGFFIKYDYPTSDWRDLFIGLLLMVGLVFTVSTIYVMGDISVKAQREYFEAVVPTLEEYEKQYELDQLQLDIERRIAELEKKKEGV